MLQFTHYYTLLEFTSAYQFTSTRQIYISTPVYIGTPVSLSCATPSLPFVLRINLAVKAQNYFQVLNLSIPWENKKM
jgi:hypothetical protein